MPGKSRTTFKLVAEKLSVEVSEEAEVIPAAGVLALLFGARDPGETTTQETDVAKQASPKQQPAKGPPPKQPKRPTPAPKSPSKSK